MQFTSAIITLIIIIIIAIWFTHYFHQRGKLPQGAFRNTYENFVNSANYKYDEYFTHPNELFNKTIGYELDDNAKLALSKTQKKDKMYTDNEILGSMSQSNIGDAASNSFILASLLNYNVAPNEENPNKTKRKAAHYFNKTLNRITANTEIVLKTQPAEFIVDRAQDFYNDYIIQNTEIVVPDFNQIRDRVRATRNNIAKTNVKKSNKNKPPKALEQDVYYSDRVITSDPQNVHDSQVNTDMKDIYERIRSSNTSNKTDDEILEDINQVINTFPFTDKNKKSSAKNISNLMASGTIKTALGASEKQILIEVWKRINDPKNNSQRESLKQSFINALVDGVENGKNVCTLGRCNRMLGTLTLLDNDPEVSKPVKTTEILRNEVFGKAHHIITTILKDTPKEIADAYQNLDYSDEHAKSVEILENKLKTEVESILREEYQSVKPNILDNLIKDAQAGI